MITTDTVSTQSFWHFTAGLPYKVAVIFCPQSPPNPFPPAGLSITSLWLHKGNPGKLMALLPPLVPNDPAVSCGVYSPWASC